MFMVLSSWQSHCKSSPSSFDECRTAPNGSRPKTKPDDLGCESACTGCQSLHPRSPFIIITQPESRYSFYRPTEGRRLSWPSWLVTYRDGLPVHRWSPIRVLTGSDVAQLRWSKPTCYQWVVVLVLWLSANMLVSVDEVAPFRTRFIRGPVTVLGWLNHLRAEPAIQFSSAWQSLHG